MEVEILGRTFRFFSSGMQIEKAIRMLEKYFLNPRVIIVLIILGLYLCFRFGAFVLKKQKMRNVLITLSPWVYLIIILGITIFNREPTGVRELRLVPDAWFAGKENYHESNVITAVLDMILYIPYGFLLYKRVVKRKKYIGTVMIIFITSFFIEALQYIFALGVASSEDFVMNLIGGFIGAAIGVFCKK